MERFCSEAYHPEETKTTNAPENGLRKERQETGKNVTIHTYLIRHGERLPNHISPETELTENGRKECIEFGNKIGKSAVIGGEYSCRDKKTECLRTKETAELIVYSSRAEDKRPVEKREELSSHASEGFRNKIRAHVKKILLGKNPDLSEEKIDKIDLLSTVEGIDFYLNCKEEDLDAQTYPPLETAASVALRIDAAIKKTGELNSDSAMDYVIATHDYVIAAFLQQVLLWKKENGQTKRGFNSLAELGDSSIEFLENLEIIIKTDSKGSLIAKIDNEGNKTIDATFRDRKCGIGMDWLYELAKIGSSLKKAEKENR